MSGKRTTSSSSSSVKPQSERQPQPAKKSKKGLSPEELVVAELLKAPDPPASAEIEEQEESIEDILKDVPEEHPVEPTEEIEEGSPTQGREHANQSQSPEVEGDQLTRDKRIVKEYEQKAAEIPESAAIARLFPGLMSEMYDIVKARITDCRHRIRQQTEMTDPDEIDVVCTMGFQNMQPLLNTMFDRTLDNKIRGIAQLGNAYNRTIKEICRAAEELQNNDTTDTDLSHGVLMRTHRTTQDQSESASNQVISAVTAGKMPTIHAETFESDVKGYADRYNTWKKSFRAAHSRHDIPADQLAEHMCQRAWLDRTPDKYGDMEWTDTSIPLEYVCDVWYAQVRTDTSTKSTWHDSKTKELQAMINDIVDVNTDNRQEMYLLQATLDILYKKAAAEQPAGAFTVKEDRDMANIFFKKIRFTGEDTSNKVHDSEQFRQDVRRGYEKALDDGTASELTLALVFEHLIKEQHEAYRNLQKAKKYLGKTYKSNIVRSPSASPSPNKRFKGSPTPHKKGGVHAPIAISDEDSTSPSPQPVHTPKHSKATSSHKKSVAASPFCPVCNICGRKHRQICRFADHPMRNDTDYVWHLSPAGRYFKKEYSLDYLYVLKVNDGELSYKRSADFKPSLKDISLSVLRKYIYNPEGQLGIVGDVSVNTPQCTMLMQLTYTQGNLQANASKDVEVLLDTGNSGRDLVSSDIVRELDVVTTPIDSTSISVVKLVNNTILSLVEQCTLTLSVNGQTFTTIMHVAKDLPYDIILSYTTIVQYSLLQHVIPSGTPNAMHKRKFESDSSHDAESIDTTTTSTITEEKRARPAPPPPTREVDTNFSTRDPHSLEELAHIEDEDLEAIPGELLEAKQDDTAWRDLLEQRVQGTPTLRRALQMLLETYKDRFRATVSDTPADVEEFDFEVDLEQWETKAHSGPPRRQDLRRQEAMEKMITVLLAHGVIVESTASHYSHGFVVPKKTPGKWRLVIDYRILNALTKEFEHWPIPHIKQLLTRIGAYQPKFFAVMDLTSGYYQIANTARARKLTAFMTARGLYEWRRLPMGLKGAPSFFQRVMAQTVLAGLTSTCCELYMDDVIIFGDTEESFQANVDKVLARFRKYRITVSPDKCIFGGTSVEYVGHIISADGVSFNKEKLNQVKDIELPQTMGQLRSFLGLVNWYGSHLKGYAMIAAPLHDMLTGTYSKKTRLVWTADLIDRFERLKSDIVSCSPLEFLDTTSPIILQTDASDYGMGAVLYQQKDGKMTHIALLSKKFDKTQLRWSTPEKEAFAIYHSLKTWHYLLSDRRFTLHTDHKNLIELQTSCGPNLKVMRWFQAIQDFDMKLEHIPGLSNIVADALSRSVELPDMTPSAITCVIADEEYVPSEWFDTIASHHNAVCGHGGVERTLSKLRASGHTWRGMRRHVQYFARTCPRCQKMSQVKPAVRSSKFVVTSQFPMEQVAVDFIEGLPDDAFGFKAIAVVIDSFSRFVELYPTRGVTASDACGALIQHFGRYGVPHEVLSDNGPAFTSDLMDAVTLLLDVEHLKITPYSHEENGVVERANKAVKRFLSDLVHSKDVKSQWSLVLPLVQRIMNAAEHESIGTSPASMVFGSAINLDRTLVYQEPVDTKEDISVNVQEHMDQLLAKQRAVFLNANMILRKKIHKHLANELTIVHTTFPVKSLVLAQPREGTQQTKFSNKWRGPMEVEAISKDGNTYTLRDMITQRSNNYNVNFLRAYRADERHQSLIATAMTDHDDFYQVDRVVDMKGDPAGPKSQLSFLVHWTGYDVPTWEPWAELRKVEQLHHFLQGHPNRKVRALVPKSFQA